MDFLEADGRDRDDRHVQRVDELQPSIFMNPSVARTIHVTRSSTPAINPA